MERLEVGEGLLVLRQVIAGVLAGWPMVERSSTGRPGAPVGGEVVAGAGSGSHGVDLGQPHGAADGGVGSVSGAQHVALAVHADLLSDRSVHHKPKGRAAGAGVDRVDPEFRRGDGFDEGQDYREVLGPASCHHGVDRHLLNGDDPAAFQILEHHLIGPAPGDVEELLDLLDGRRDDGEPVGPALVVAELDRAVQVINHKDLRPQWAGHVRS